MKDSIRLALQSDRPVIAALVAAFLLSMLFVPHSASAAGNGMCTYSASFTSTPSLSPRNYVYARVSPTSPLTSLSQNFVSIPNAAGGATATAFPTDLGISNFAAPGAYFANSGASSYSQSFTIPGSSAVNVTVKGVSQVDTLDVALSSSEAAYALLQYSASLWLDALPTISVQGMAYKNVQWQASPINSSSGIFANGGTSQTYTLPARANGSPHSIFYVEGRLSGSAYHISSRMSSKAIGSVKLLLGDANGPELGNCCDWTMTATTFATKYPSVTILNPGGGLTAAQLDLFRGLIAKTIDNLPTGFGGSPLTINVLSDAGWATDPIVQANIPSGSDGALSGAFVLSNFGIVYAKFSVVTSPTHPGVMAHELGHIKLAAMTLEARGAMLDAWNLAHTNGHGTQYRPIGGGGLFDGCTSDYGCTSTNEDIMEFVNSAMEPLFSCDPPGTGVLELGVRDTANSIYRDKLNILLNNGFITAQRYGEIKKYFPVMP